MDAVWVAHFRGGGTVRGCERPGAGGESGAGDSHGAGFLRRRRRIPVDADAAAGPVASSLSERYERKAAMGTRSCFAPVPFKTPRTDSSTRSGVMRRMQTASLQAEFFWFAAVTQGEQESSAQMASVFPRLPYSFGVSGPNSTMERMGVIAEKCAGPLSFETRTSA